MDISLTEQYRQHRSPQASALAVLAWALIFSLYALLLKFVLLRKALPMSEAAKSRGTSRVEFAENVASCIVAISTHIYLGPAALMLSLHHQFQGYPAAFSAFVPQPPKQNDVLQDLLCGQLGEMFTGNVLYQIIFWFLKWETGIDALLHHIGFFLAGVLILNLAVYPKLASSAMCMEVSSIFLSTHLMFRQIDGKLCALLSDVAAAFFALTFLTIRILWFGYCVVDFIYHAWMEPEIPQNVGVTKSVIAAAVFGLGWILQLYWSQLVVSKAAKAAKAMLGLT